MTKEMIRCPKCSHEQTNPVECEACGLLFRKFEQVRERKKEEEPPRNPKPAGSGSRIGTAVILVVLTAAVTYYFAGGTRPATVVAPTPPAAEIAAENPGSSPPPQTAGPRQQSAERATAVIGSPIEQAKNGTVAIETPWGKGSGFFIGDTTIVTNKHVVAPDRSQVNEIRHKVETSRKLIALEREKIKDFRRRMQEMEDGPTRRQLALIIQESEKELARVLPAQEEGEARLKELERPMSTSDIKIFLSDGSEYTAQSSQVSATRDLALVSIYAGTPTILKTAPPNSALQQGDKVFTIGNPVGLRNTVTAGIFSGYRQHKETGEVMLQTDAPINPGNSGGPLIDERGRVHGVNTMIIRDTQGIGFAIPIQVVFEEFSISPPPVR